MSRAVYLTNCNESTARAINSMTDQAREITRATFLKHVDRESLKAVEKVLGYDEYASQGLTMAGDAYVTYYRSKYRGRPCLYFKQSGTEFIFR